MSTIPQALASVVTEATPVRRHRERGMATVEYALGVVLVVVIIGVVIAAIQTGTFDQLVEKLIGAIFDYINKVFTIPFGVKG